jgi:hypothetical protein
VPGLARAASTCIPNHARCLWDTAWLPPSLDRVRRLGCRPDAATLGRSRFAGPTKRADGLEEPPGRITPPSAASSNSLCGDSAFPGG